MAAALSIGRCGAALAGLQPSSTCALPQLQLRSHSSRRRSLQVAGPSPRCSSLVPSSSVRQVVARSSMDATSSYETVSSSEETETVVQPRRLILLRHADSEATTEVRDHERPISEQGRKQAVAIGKRLQELGWLPDLILASNSKRTMQTMETMTEAYKELSSVDIHFIASWYTVAALDGQTRQHIEEVIRGTAADAKCVMCVGHNKGWEEAASSFARTAVRLSTASAALFETAAASGSSWEDAIAAEDEWRLVQVVTP